MCTEAPFFYPVQNLHFWTSSSESLVIYCTRSKRPLFGRYLFNFSVVYWASFLNIGQQNGSTKKARLRDQMFDYETPWAVLVSLWLFGTNSWLTARSAYLKVSITCSVMISYVFRDLWSQLKSQECVANYCFASLSIILSSIFSSLDYVIIITMVTMIW